MILALERYQPVTFSTEEEGLSLPSPVLLKLHAACAKVAHLSGAGEIIDDIQRDMESTPVLNGTSANLLGRALLFSLNTASVGV